MAALLFFNQCLPAHETILVEVHQTAETHFDRRILLLFNQSFLAAIEVDVDQEQARLDARDVERQHSGRGYVERPAALYQSIPHVQCAICIGPDFITEITRVSRAGNLNRHAGNPARRHAKVFQASDVGIFDNCFQEPRRGWPLQRQRGDAFRDVFDLHVEPDGVLREPAQARVGRRPAINVFFQPRHRAVVDHFAVLVAPRRVNHLAHRNLSHVARDDAIDQSRCIFSRDSILEQRRDIDQRGGIANGVVLVVVMGLVRADRIVARPFAVVQAFAKPKRSLMKWSANGHGQGSEFKPQLVH